MAGMARSLRAGMRLGPVVGMALGLLLAGCASPPPPPPPTQVVLTLTATQDVNPTPAGQGAPIVLRVYQLASTAGFTGAEFFDLFNNDQGTLKSDLVKRDDVTLAPGQSKTLTLSPNDQAKALGVFAGYRDYASATWRVTADIPPHKTTKITVQAGRTGLAITPPPASPAPAQAGS
jgi:type VI secretion system protein VasD